MVSDSGSGFEPEAARKGRGLGLISREERVKFLNGTFSIESKVKSGTTIHVRVPRKEIGRRCRRVAMLASNLLEGPDLWSGRLGDLSVWRNCLNTTFVTGCSLRSKPTFTAILLSIALVLLPDFSPFLSEEGGATQWLR